MLVGEPTLMGGELGDEDERLITRLENTQYKPSSDDEPDYKPTISQSQSMYSNHVPLGAWQQDSINSGAAVQHGGGDQPSKG
jgi:LIM interaction domain (LID)